MTDQVISKPSSYLWHGSDKPERVIVTPLEPSESFKCDWGMLKFNLRGFCERNNIDYEAFCSGMTELIEKLRIHDDD